MPQNKFIKWVLLGLLIINISLVFFFPVKPPKIVTFSLPNSPIDPQISLTFSELMDKQTVTSGFRITPAVKGKISWAGKNFVFTPDQNLEFGKKYEVSFSAAARSMRGQGIGKTWLREFETMPSSFLFVNKNGQLERFFVNDGGDKKLTPENMKIRQYDYDSITQKIVFVTQDDKIYLTDLDGGPSGAGQAKPKNISTADIGGGSLGRAKWLPFEDAFLVTNIGKEKTSLWKFSVNGGDEQLIKQSETLSYDFFPSPDGKKVLFIDERGALVLYDLKTEKEDLVVRDFFEHFGFSEYGGYILYTIMSDQGVFDFSNNLVLHKSNGDKEILFKGKNVRIKQPIVSPNEDFLAFEHMQDDANNYSARISRLGILDLSAQSGSGEAKLLLATPDSYQIKSPQIAPDNNMIVFNKFTDEEHMPGWDIDKKQMITTPLMMEELKGEGGFDGEITELKVEGAEVQWAY